MTTEDFVRRSMVVHENYYSYPNTVYVGALEKVVITCPVHGDFLQEPRHHLDGHGCMGCKESLGEAEIARVLTLLGITFEREKMFPECRLDRKLRFDFSFVHHGEQWLIEFDGAQHTRKVKGWGDNGEFEKTQIRDQIKNQFAIEAGFNLLRIPFDCDDIETVIQQSLGVRHAEV